MSARLHNHANLLKLLHKSNLKSRQNILKRCCDAEFVKCITECVRNLLAGNVPLNQAQKKKLAIKKKILRQVALKKTSFRKKRKLIQSGGFLGTLLGPIISVLGGLFNNGTR
jgi:hypothetical protein